MSFTTIMVYADIDETPEQRVRLAATLAKKFTAKLIGFSACAVAPPIGAESPVILEVLAADTQEIKAKLSKKEDWFRGIINAKGCDHNKFSWRFVVDYPTESLARESRCADLIVVGRTKRPNGVYSTLDLGGIVLKAGRPVVVVPDGIGSINAKHVVVGWKDTREARRALLDSLPFLHEAERISIVEICNASEKDAQERVNDVVIYLGRHSIKAEAKIIQHDKASDAARLTRFAQDQGADLLVVGAYGHSRLGEWIFGGMTRELLAGSPICCFMSH